jgi:glycerol-3-phosphate acyltransferase PlsY
MSSPVFAPLCAVFVGYLLGSISFAVIIARRYGVDILKAGSGNPGATNVKRVCGKRPGNLVFILDALKGTVAAGGPWLLAQILAAASGADTTASGDAWWADGATVRNAQLSGFLGAVLGHCFSVFLKFKGGKGVAVSAGGFLGAVPLCLGVGAVVWLVVYLFSRYVSVASLVAGLSLPVTGYFAWGVGDPRFWVGLLIAVFFLFTHRGNIIRLVRGEEHRFAKAPPAENRKE